MSASHVALITLAISLAIAVAVAWRTRYQLNRFRDEAAQAILSARQSANERDMAQRLVAQHVEEDRELAREKNQFQAKLAEYEKYAALSQLALGAAHDRGDVGALVHRDARGRRATAGW